MYLLQKILRLWLSPWHVRSPHRNVGGRQLMGLGQSPRAPMSGRAGLSGAAGEGQAGVRMQRPGAAWTLSYFRHPFPPPFSFQLTQDHLKGVHENLGQMGRRDLPPRPLHSGSQGGCLLIWLLWVNLKGHPLFPGVGTLQPKY